MADDGGRATGLEPFGQPLAAWVRYPRYEIQDGLIRPAPGGAPEQYDPWEAYRVVRSGRGGQAPYESLMELAWSARLLAPARQWARLEPSTDRAVLAWCAAHGLLGMLPHEAEAAELAPRWGRAPDPLKRVKGLVPVRKIYSWGPAGWQEVETWWGSSSESVAAGVRKHTGELVPRRLWPELWRPPELIGRFLGEGALHRMPLGEIWGRYFGDIHMDEAAEHAYPLPLSPEFWAAYGEPIQVFLLGAGLFLETLRGLNPERRAGEDAAGYAHRRAAADRGLFSLTAGVHPALVAAPDGSYQPGWRAKSLLASFAMMAYLDIAAGMRVLDCDVCEKPFVTAAYQARYCSARCRNTAMKRAYRGRLRSRLGPFWLLEPADDGEPTNRPGTKQED